MESRTCGEIISWCLWVGGFINYLHSVHRSLMYARGLADKLVSIANLIGERGEMAKQPLPDFLLGSGF
jgi:hypothetical protein